MYFAFKDSINLGGKLTLRRTLNAGRVLGSYWISRLSGRALHRGMPVSVSIEPTTSCNLRCPECPSGLRSFQRPTGMLDDATFRDAIDQLGETLIYLTFYFQGEPYLNPRFLDYVRYAASKNIYTATSTNAHYLDDRKARATVESGLDRLIISIDGTTQETYASYRVGGNLQKVIEGTNNIIRWKKELGSATPHVIFQFLVVRPNEHQVDEVKQLASELGVDQVVFKTAQVYNYEDGSPLIPVNQEFSRYKKKKDGTYSIKNKLLNHCWKMWQGCVITWDGQIVPCCFDKDADHSLGSLQKDNFRNIWKSAPYQNFRSAVLRGRDQIDICKNCTEGTKVFA